MALKRSKTKPKGLGMDQQFDLFGFADPVTPELVEVDVYGDDDNELYAAAQATQPSTQDVLDAASSGITGSEPVDGELADYLDSDDELAASVFGVSELSIGELARRAQSGRLDNAPRRVNMFDLTAVTAATTMATETAATKKDEFDVEKMSKDERNAYIKALGDELNLYPHLLAIKPRERYVFRSDHVEVDTNGAVMCVLAFFHADEANDEFLSFWGVDRLPDNMPDGVRAILIESVERKSDKWIIDAEKKSERLTKLDEREQSSGGTMRTKRKTAKSADDLFTTIGELQDGATYLSVHMRLALYASSLDKLDAATERLGRQYIDRIPSVTTAPYHGEQRQELSTLLASNDKRRGLGFHFTSTEYSGAYSLVTNGLRDTAGEYVGRMSGDYNTSAILLEVDRWDHHMVCGDETINEKLGRIRTSDMWASKISQAALLNNHRVVHMVLNGADLYRLGPKMESITTRLDMSLGEINMFEMFGDRNDQLSVFDVHMSKLVLMYEQMLGPGTSEESLRMIRGELREALTTFYTERRMWFYGAEKRPEQLRLVGIKHSQVPRLQLFLPYLDTLYDKLVNQSAQENLRIAAIKAIQDVTKRMLHSNSQLFNQFTSDRLDEVGQARRVIYDFSDLVNRGEDLAMAQLVNAIGFASNSLQRDDVLIVHGTDEISSPSVQDFLARRFDRLMDKVGVRVALFYDKPDTMMAHREFNRFERADYTVLGPMAKESISNYETLMRTAIPGELKQLLAMRGYALSYLRRNQVNVVFSTELSLGMDIEVKEADAQAGEEVASRVAQVRRDAILAERGAETEFERDAIAEHKKRQEELLSYGTAPAPSTVTNSGK